MIRNDYLAVSWSTSRGRDTYGYNICRLDVRSTDRRFKCMGGGYDMLGTVVGEWLQETFQTRLLAMAHRAHSLYKPGKGTCRNAIEDADTLYGMTLYYVKADDFQDLWSAQKVVLDGACGVSSMERIAEAIGISLSRTYNRRGHTTGYMVTDYGSAEAMAAALKSA